MTQVIGLLTPGCVFLAADRLLTWSGGHRDGAVYSDEECKLVALCGFGGIGYTGLARLSAKPTHEWIAITLAKAGCKRIADAVRVLPETLPIAVRTIPPHLRGLTLMAAAWDWFGEPPLLCPHFSVITNQYDETGKLLLSCPTESFRVFTRPLRAFEPFIFHSVGQPLSRKRATTLSRSLRRAMAHRVGPNHLLEYIVREIQHTSEGQCRVGDKILAMSVPRRAVNAWLRCGKTLMVGGPANRSMATFGYFSPRRSGILQFGPTYTCGESAITDFTSTEDETGNKQSVSVKLLNLPRSTNTG